MTDQNRPTDDDDGTPKFGRLLIVLQSAVALVGFITLASEAANR